MRSAFLIIVFVLSNIIFSIASEVLLKECRKLIGKAFKDKSVAEQLYDKLSDIDTLGNNVLYGYRGAVEMSFGKHESGLIKRGKYFSSGKDKLEAAISKDPNNVELIFLRYTIQYNLPSFLGYTGKLEQDREVLESAVDTMQEMEILKGNILNFLKNNPEE